MNLQLSVLLRDEYLKDRNTYGSQHTERPIRGLNKPYSLMRQNAFADLHLIVPDFMHS